jgi:hypothetical protein
MIEHAILTTRTPAGESIVARALNFVESPSQFLYIIHDKMDHTKTAIPRMQRITKATSGLG